MGIDACLYEQSQQNKENGWKYTEMIALYSLSSMLVIKNTME